MKLLQGQCATNKSDAGIGSVEPGKVQFIDRNIAQAQELLERERVNWSESMLGEGKGGREDLFCVTLLLFSFLSINCRRQE